MKFSPQFKKLSESVTPDSMQKMLDTMSMYKIYTTLGISDQLLLKYIKHHNLLFKKAFRTIHDLSDSEKNQIIDEWVSSQIPKRDLASKFSIGPTTINRLLKERGVRDREKSQINPEFQKYQKLVIRLTTVVKRFYNLETPEGYDWDHRLSIYEGYKQNIHPNIIASRENLELIPSSINRSNGEISSITHKELLILCGVHSSP